MTMIALTWCANELETKLQASSAPEELMLSLNLEANTFLSTNQGKDLAPAWSNDDVVLKVLNQPTEVSP